MNLIKGCFLDVKKGKGASVIEFEDTLDEYYKRIGCDDIEIYDRTIGGKKYCVVCDGVGALKRNPKVSAFNHKNLQVMFYGNLIITGVADSAGELTSLSDEDVKRIFEQLTILMTTNTAYVVLECDY